jgi:hypothetical protein
MTINCTHSLCVWPMLRHALRTTISLGMWVALAGALSACGSLSGAPRATTRPQPTAQLAEVDPTQPPIQTTAAPDPQNTKKLKYAEGMEAYSVKQWPKAVKSFREVSAIQSNYLDVTIKLADSYNEWGREAIAQGDAPTALERFNSALVTEPTYAPALAQRNLVMNYLDGVRDSNAQSWQSAIDHFEVLRAAAGDYIDSATLLYTCYTQLATWEAQQKNLTGALDLYQKAAALPVEPNQVVEAQAHVKELEILTTPLVFTASLFDNPNDGAVVCGSKFEANVWGRVRDNNGGRIRGATVQVASADGKNRFRVVTNGKGEFKVPGLGCTNWVVKLTSVPDAPAGIHAGSVSAFINGGSLSGAGVEFRQK